MKKITRLFCLSAFLALICMPSHATVVTFENDNTGPFSTDGASVIATPITASSGYNNVAAYTGSTWVAFNPSEVSPSSFFLTGGGTFDLTSFVIAGAWGSQTLTIDGLLNNVIVDSVSLAVTTVAQLFNANWAGIDTLRISTGNDFVQDFALNGRGQHWALDNLTINENAAVPEPGTLLLVGAGLAFAIRRRKA